MSNGGAMGVSPVRVDYGRAGTPGAPPARKSCIQESDMSKGLIVLVVLVVIVLALFGQYVGVKNQLVAKDQAVKAAWPQVDSALQRRAELSPGPVPGFGSLSSDAKGGLCHEGSGSGGGSGSLRG